MFLHLESYMLPCFSKTIFGFTCLGCGLQRGFLLLIQGDFIAAFKMYPAIYTLVLLLLFITINLFKKFKNSNKIISKLAYINLSIMIINYLIKLNL